MLVRPFGRRVASVSKRARVHKPGLCKRLCIKGLYTPPNLPAGVIAFPRWNPSATMAKFNPLYATANELQRLLAEGKLSSVDIIKTYLNQVRAFNPRLRAVIQTAPESLLICRAEALDSERQENNIRGPLHGIPILIKVYSTLLSMVQDIYVTLIFIFTIFYHGEPLLAALRKIRTTLTPIRLLEWVRLVALLPCFTPSQKQMQSSLNRSVQYQEMFQR